jgi:hypothetical protein
MTYGAEEFLADYLALMFLRRLEIAKRLRKGEASPKRMRNLTRLKIRLLKQFLERGWTVRSALKFLHLGGSTYSRYGRLVWDELERGSTDPEPRAEVETETETEPMRERARRLARLIRKLEGMETASN